jgi:hypothetical protein
MLVDTAKSKLMTNLAAAWVHKHPSDTQLVAGLLARVKELQLRVSPQEILNRKDKNLMAFLTDAINDHLSKPNPTPTPQEVWESLSPAQQLTLAMQPGWVFSAFLNGKASDIEGVDKPPARPWGWTEEQTLVLLRAHFGPTGGPRWEGEEA